MKPHEIERRETPQGQLEIDLDLPSTLYWFQGHFAAQPLLPGVAQLEWAINYATELLAPGFRFHSVQSVKFQAPLLPENKVTLTLNWQEERQVLTFSYQRHDGEARQTASSGKVRLCR